MSDGTTATQRYYVWGAIRSTTGTMPADYAFTGQRLDASGLLDYNARWYDPALARFISADSIVPQPGNPQSLNRFAYCLNNPTRYVDPSGHDPLDASWEAEFEQRHGRKPNWRDQQVRLFSIAFPSEYEEGKFYSWDPEDEDPLVGILRDWSGQERSWAHMPEVLQRLAAWYKPSEEAAFVHDVGFLFAGVRSRFETQSWRAASGGQIREAVWIRREGLGEKYTGVIDADANVHHWAWAFMLGYFQGTLIGRTVNRGHEMVGAARAGRSPLDVDTVDIRMGGAAVRMGNALRNPRLEPADASNLLRTWLPIEQGLP